MKARNMHKFINLFQRSINVHYNFPHFSSHISQVRLFAETSQAIIHLFVSLLSLPEHLLRLSMEGIARFQGIHEQRGGWSINSPGNGPGEGCGMAAVVGERDTIIFASNLYKKKCLSCFFVFLLFSLFFVFFSFTLVFSLHIFAKYLHPINIVASEYDMFSFSHLLPLSSLLLLLHLPYLFCSLLSLFFPSPFLLPFSFSSSFSPLRFPFHISRFSLCPPFSPFLPLLFIISILCSPSHNKDEKAHICNNVNGFSRVNKCNFFLRFLSVYVCVHSCRQRDR